MTEIFIIILIIYSLGTITSFLIFSIIYLYKLKELKEVSMCSLLSWFALILLISIKLDSYINNRYGSKLYKYYWYCVFKDGFDEGLKIYASKKIVRKYGSNNKKVYLLYQRFIRRYGRKKFRGGK